MTDAPSSAATPQPKAPAEPLDVRAPRPPVVRLRRSVVTAAVMSAAGLLAMALAWAFVVQPEIRAEARARPLDAAASDGDIRPSGRVTDGPSGYGEADRLPEPRRLGGDRESVPSQPVADDAPPPRSGPTPRAGAGSPAAEARQSDLFFAAGGSGAAAPAAKTTDAPSRDYAAVYNTHQLLAPLSPYEVKAGAVIPAALITGVDTSRAGPVVATVTENVFDSISGRHLLIPQGARLVGRHEGESRHGDRRAFLAWDRLILPNGKSLILNREPGVDAQGRTGLKGRVDRRLFPLAVATLFAGAITTLGQAARDDDDRSGGLLGDAGDAAAVEAAQVGGKLIDRELQVRPQIRLKPGARVRVLVTRDLLLEPYRP
ncbi:MAG: TrbI/VirB10 family protein [Phenylobacterium sp.]|uniref:TrbI/VirB10 family protein n=1 Tax=Phenylobacterium sp. TaxID=1871053 RepID=UPI003918BDD1